jgi:hypothetical protein
MKWSFNAACNEWNIDLKTLKKGLASRGHVIRKGAKFTTLQICAAIYGDLEFERILETRARRLALERDNEEADGLTVKMEEVQQLYSEALLPVRQRFLAMPAECATRANPTDPQFAREALQHWVDAALPLIREQLPKPK